MHTLAIHPDSLTVGARLRSFITQRSVTLGVAAITLVLGILPFDHLILQLTPEALMHGRIWTMHTAPLLHVSFEHLLLDVLGLLVVGFVFEPMFGWRRWLAIIIAINLAVGLSIFTLYRHLHEFRGLSALDQGLLSAGALALWLRRDRAAGLVIAATLAIKWSLELTSGDSTADQFFGGATNFGQSVPWAHVIGGFAGAFAALISLGSSANPQAAPTTPQLAEATSHAL
jgi:rhomboid family GlyGly-CTERM serine protease